MMKVKTERKLERHEIKEVCYLKSKTDLMQIKTVG